MPNRALLAVGMALVGAGQLVFVFGADEPVLSRWLHAVVALIAGGFAVALWLQARRDKKSENA